MSRLTPERAGRTAESGPADGRLVRTFCTSSRRPESGPHAPPTGRAASAPAAAPLRPRQRPSAGAQRGQPCGPPTPAPGQDAGESRWAGSRPAAVGGWAAGWVGARQHRRASCAGCGVAVTVPPAGASGSGMAKITRGRRWWVVAAGCHPARRRPGQAEPEPGPRSVVRPWALHLDRGPEPGSPRAGRRQTGWQEGRRLWRLD